MSALLAASGLHLRHPRSDRDAIRDLHLELREGEILALLGPNGSGKSTALAGLARSLRPRSGEVRLGTDSIWDLPSRLFARRVARLPQEPSCPEGLTVEELVGCGRYPHLG
ncbi:MAG TPA: ABC transporter ATP-binding protein, partial [Thermoanaerobaculia bacterium]|nr:ABC transporter ATP-binding protein [Thermoanaerobaculia bacterium]